jgi:hypothetical protein
MTRADCKEIADSLAMIRSRAVAARPRYAGAAYHDQKLIFLSRLAMLDEVVDAMADACARRSPRFQRAPFLRCAGKR